jgi:nucleoside-diphosphate kinase
MNKWALYLALSLIPCLSHATDEQTLSIIKPDAVKEQHIGDIIQRFEKNGLKVGAIKMTSLTQDKAGAFYKEHEGRPFYGDLTKFMTSGPVVVMVLSGPDAIAKNRELMGATDFKKAAPGTIRKDFAHSLTENAVHGSDSKESAKREIEFFFTPDELVNTK